MLNAPRIWMERELTSFSAGLKPGSIVLDAGSGGQRYKPRFPQCNYESADFEQVDKPYAKSNYVCDLRSIPVEDARFDAVVFTQVMEHLPDPAAVLRELNRVMKPGAVLFFTAPFWYEEHEQPYDYYRYTQFAVRHLFEGSGFQVRELRWLDGYLASVAHQLKCMGRSLPLSPKEYGGGLGGLCRWVCFMPFRMVAHPLAIMAARSDVAFRYTKKGIPMNYLAIVVKAK